MQQLLAADEGRWDALLHEAVTSEVRFDVAYVSESSQRNGQTARRLCCRASYEIHHVILSPTGQGRVFCLFPGASEVFGVHVHLR